MVVFVWPNCRPEIPAASQSGVLVEREVVALLTRKFAHDGSSPRLCRIRCLFEGRANSPMHRQFADLQRTTPSKLRQRTDAASMDYLWSGILAMNVTVFLQSRFRSCLYSDYVRLPLDPQPKDTCLQVWFPSSAIQSFAVCPPVRSESS